MNIQFQFTRNLHWDPSLGEKWLKSMNQAALENDIFIQYCMSLPREHSVLLLGDPPPKLVRPYSKMLLEKPLEFQFVWYLKSTGKIVEKFMVPDLVEI